jgi:hypothetical protein
VRDELVPDASQIFDWIERIFAQGIRRPGTPADRWTEAFCIARFREWGLERVRFEPVSLPFWEPRSWSLRATGADGGEIELPCFPLPHSAPCAELDLELAPYDAAEPAGVAGKASLHDVRLLRLPPDGPARAGDTVAEALQEVGEVGEVAQGVQLEVRPGGRVLDPRGTFEGALQVLPFGPLFQWVMEPAIAAGASAYIGALDGYPGDSCDYYVPYDGQARPIPAVWIRGSDGARLRAMLAAGAVRVRLFVDSLRETITCHNVVAELPGADDEWVVIGSHHDGPWASAVEDASGTALVLAQARYWSQVPAAERPHRLVFLLNAGHMVGGAGCRAFLDAHAGDLARIVLEIHLEHAAREFVLREDRLVPSGEPETRWLFTTCNADLESAVAASLEAEKLDRSLILAPDVFGEHPTTDAGFFHLAGVPLINFLTAPFYLFDAMDTLDKIDGPSLVPISRAAIRWVEWTRDVSAAAARAGIRS